MIIYIADSLVKYLTLGLNLVADQKPSELTGVGQSTMFTDKNGTLRIVFHSNNSTSTIHPRQMYLSTVIFENKGGKKVMVIEKNFIVPALVKK